MYYKEAAGAFVVFDVTRSSTYEAVKIWKKDLDSKCFMTDGSPVPAVLLGNKVRFVLFTHNPALMNYAYIRMYICKSRDVQVHCLCLLLLFWW